MGHFELWMAMRTIKREARLTDICNGLNMLGIISNDKLAELNKRHAKKACDAFERIKRRYNFNVE